MFSLVLGNKNLVLNDVCTFFHFTIRIIHFWAVLQCIYAKQTGESQASHATLLNRMRHFNAAS